MPLLVNLRHLENGDLHLKGELPSTELDLEDLDELIRVAGPLRYDIEVQNMEESLLAHGRISLELQCECARCLKPFIRKIEFKDWACHLELEGEEKAPITNDCADLTPNVREDILLELPQRPLCGPGCRGLPKKGAGRAKSKAKTGAVGGNQSAWAELNKLKF